MKTDLSVYPILLAGGSGTRLWPVSRELFPKQLVSFLGDEPLIQTTAKRLFPSFEPEKIRVVCGRDHSHEIVRDIEALGIEAKDKIVKEPCGRNTAPAILLGLLEILKHEKDAVVFIFPADHLIGDISAFHEKINTALSLACEDNIVTFGIMPNYPETGYGYIEASDNKKGEGFAIKRFVEKPDLNTAKSYLQAGNFFWNSGMFAFKASVMLEEFSKFKPEMVKQLQAIVSDGGTLDTDRYSQLESVSFDYAIMEHTQKGVVLPSGFGWNDIGSWKSLYDFMPKNGDGNVVLSSNVILQGTRNCFVMGHERLIAVNDLEDVVIVETPDAVFVSNMETSREVKNIVNTLKEGGRKEYQVHTKVNRPWGYYKILENTDHIKVNEIVVYENSKISDALISEAVKQLMVIGGTAEISFNGEVNVLESNQTVVIPANCAYTLENKTDVELHLIEVEKSN